jgi:TIR domain
MKIFISYSASDASEARLMASALEARGYNVFFDKETLGAGQSYDGKIERAVHSADLFIFLLSPEAIEPGRYTMSELGYAQQRWPNPDRYVLPVMVRAVDLNNVPDYLRAVTFLRPSGNLAAEVGSAVDQMLARSVAWSIARRFAFYGAFAGLVASFLAFQNQLSLIGVYVLGVPPDCGLPIGIALMVSLRRSFQGIAQWRTLACFGLAIVAVLAAPHILRVYDADLTLYPDHPLARLNRLALGMADKGTMRQPNYLRDWSDNALHDLGGGAGFLIDESVERSVPHSYVPVPVPVVLRYGAVSCAFGVIMIAGLAAIFARVPRWTVAIAGIVSAFAIGAASAVAVGLYQTSIFIAYDIAYDSDKAGELWRSLWSYPGLMLGATAWSATIFGLLGYGLAVTLPNRPQRSLEQIY